MTIVKEQQNRVVVKNSWILGVVTKSMRERTVPANLVIGGTIIRKTGQPAIWTRGGAAGRTGCGILVAAPDGSKMCPFIVSDVRNNFVNGKHALVAVWPGCYIAIGGHTEGYWMMGVYQVTEISPTPKTNPDIHCTLVAMTTNSNYKQIRPDQFIKDAEHPLFRSLKETIFTVHNREPRHVCLYRSVRDNPKGLEAVLQDTRFLEGKIHAETVDDFYDKIEATCRLAREDDADSRITVHIDIVGEVYDVFAKEDSIPDAEAIPATNPDVGIALLELCRPEDTSTEVDSHDATVVKMENRQILKVYATGYVTSETLLAGESIPGTIENLRCFECSIGPDDTFYYPMEEHSPWSRDELITSLKSNGITGKTFAFMRYSKLSDAA